MPWVADVAIADVSTVLVYVLDAVSMELSPGPRMTSGG